MLTTWSTTRLDAVAFIEERDLLDADPETVCAELHADLAETRVYDETPGLLAVAEWHARQRLAAPRCLECRDHLEYDEAPCAACGRGSDDGWCEDVARRRSAA